MTSREPQQRNSSPPMDADTKVAFRETRDLWAAEGCLPEGLDKIDIEGIAALIHQKVTLLALGNQTAEHAVKVTDFMGKLGFLRKENLISERLYDESLAMLSGRTPKLRHND